MKRLKAHIEKHGKRVSNHVKKHHKKYLIGGFGIFGVIKMIMLMFSFFAGYQLFQGEQVFAYGNDGNYDFIDGLFKNGTPGDDVIIRALYGDGNAVGNGEPYQTAYTQNWTGWNGQCSGGNMNVVFVNPTGTRDTEWVLTGYTIYVLNEGDYVFSSGVYMKACNAFIGSGDVYVYSDSKIDAMVYNDGYEIFDSVNGISGHDFNIIDNIHIDGINDGAGSTHLPNTAGLIFNKGLNLKNFTMNNVKVYNHNYGINGVLKYGLINNSQFFNNKVDGLNLVNSDNGLINNAQFYNNGSKGLNITDTNNLSINNSQFYNNVDGLFLGDVDGFALNNSNYYNNSGAGISFDGDTNNFSLNNVSSYNNNNGVVFSVSHAHSNNFYYGTFKLFDNSDVFISSAKLDAGGATHAGLGRSAGVLDTGGCMSCDWITNPKSSNYFATIPLFVDLQDDINYCSARGVQTWVTAYNNITYTYGEAIAIQETGVVYSGVSLVLSDIDYNSVQYIAQTDKIGSYSGYACDVPFVELVLFSGTVEYDSPFMFTWTGRSDSGFWFEIDDDSDFSSRIMGVLKSNSTYSIELSLDPGSYDLNTNYYWRVQNKETSLFTSGWMFVLEDTIDPTVRLLAPDDGTIVTESSRTFSWDGDDSYQVSGYTLYITGAKDYEIDGFTNMSQNISDLINGDYTWWVVVEDTEGNTGFDSNGPYNFTVNIDNTAPIASVIYNPELTSWATGSVEATLTGESETITITSVGGNTHIFNSNGIFLFEFEDAAGNTGEALATGNWLDNNAPTFMFSNRNGNECEAGSLYVTNASDGGIQGIEYSFDESTWGATSSIVISAQQPGTQNETVWVRDGLFNIASRMAGYTFNNVLPTADDVPVSNVKNRYKIINWKTNSNAMDGACGSSDIISGQILSDGIKGNCAIDGDDITYTPNNNVEGSDTCDIEITDNEGSTGSFTITWNDIDTIDPNVELLLPTIDESIDTGTVIFQWSGSDDGLGIDEYELYIDGVLTGTTSLTGYTMNGLSDGTYTWYVVATDNAGNTGQSSPRNFDVNLDSDAPIASLVYTPNSFTNTDVTVEITLNETGTIINNGGSDTYIFTSNGTFLFEFEDESGNTGESLAEVTWIDKVNPLVNSISPISGTVFDTGTVVFEWSGSDDGLGIDEYELYIDGVLTGTTTDTGFTLNGLSNNTYNWYVVAIDVAGNTGITVVRSFDINVDIVGPDVSTGYISSGNVVVGNSYNYYNGIVDIKADIIDIDGISGDTCEYTINNGGARSGALYSGTNNTGYCYMTGLDGSLLFGISVGFRVEDINGNMSTGVRKTYIYDEAGPLTGELVINNDDLYVNTGIVDIVIMSCPTEIEGVGFVGLSGMYISNNLIPNSSDSFYECDSPFIITGWNLSGDEGTNTVYMRGVDKLGNMGEIVNDQIELDTQAPTRVINNGTEAGPLQNDTINVTASDSNLSGGSLVYGFSVDNICDATDTYNISFINSTNFNITGDHIDYLCVKASDILGATSYSFVGQLNTDNTGPTVTEVTGITTPTNDITPDYEFNTTESGSIIYGGACSGVVTSAISGDNIITFNALGEGTYTSCIITVTDTAGNISSNLNITSFVIDITDPNFSGVESGMIYSGNRIITFSDDHLFEATLNAVAYTSGDAITVDGNYVFVVNDLAGNSTGASFEIDQTAPVISFIDFVEAGPVASDTVSVNFSDASFSGYKLVANTGECSSTGLTYYTGAITYNDASNNGDYFCAYATDELGNSALIYSDNTLNINTSATTISITDNFGAGPVQTGIVTITGFNITGDISYKIVDNIASCDNTGGVSYTGELTYNDETNNTKYICAYASGVVNGTFATGVSNEINIDITTPIILTGDIIYDPAEVGGFVNTDVTATLSGYDEPITVTNNSGNLDYIFTGNDSFIFEFEDEAGNTGEVEAMVDWIDKISPILSEVTAVVDPTNDTTPDYTFSSNESGSIAYEGDCTSSTVSAISGDNTITFDVLGGGLHSNCTITVTDSVGNISSTLNISSFSINTSVTTITITDNFSVVPVQTGTVSITGFNITGDISYKIVADIASCDNAGGEVYTGELTYNDEINNIKYICAYASGVVNGTFATGVSNEINIDITTPIILTGDIIYNPAEVGGFVNTDVTATLSGYDEPITVTNNSGNLDYIFTGNDSFIFEFEDLAGNTGEVEAVVTWIDKTVPVLPVCSPGSSTFGGIISVSCDGDDGTIRYTTGGGVPTCSSTERTTNLVFTETTTLNAVQCDAAGNISTVATNTYTYNSTSFTVLLDSIIDTYVNESFVVTGTFSTGTNDFVSGDVSITNGTINNFQEISTTVYTWNVIPASEGVVTVKINTNVSTNSIGTDNDVSNIISKTYDITNPVILTGDIIYNPAEVGGFVNTDVTATLSGYDEPITVTNNSGNLDYIFTGNDSFIFEFEDLAGNTGEVEAVVIWIDKEGPTIVIQDDVDPNLNNYDFIHVGRGDPVVKKRDYNLTNICPSNNSGEYNNFYPGVGFAIENDNHNGEYICIYAEDDLGNISTAVSVNTINVDATDPTFAGVESGMVYSGNRTIYFDDDNLSGATLSGVIYHSGDLITVDGNYVFVVSDLAGNSTGASFEIDQTAPIIDWIDQVALGPVASDTVSVDFVDASYSGYKLVTNTGDCSGTGLTDYTGAITYIDESNNGKYFCTYATDELGNSALIYSDNTLNINTSATTISITDNFSVIPVQTGTVTITGANISGDISYKIIDNIASCDNTGGVSYTGELIYNDETNNTKYICAYASGVVNGTFATGVSNEINIDITDPTFAGVTSGTAYSGDITITFGDNNLSGATLNGATYTSGTVITDDNSYVFVVSDLAGNSTGASFFIDKSCNLLRGGIINHGESATGYQSGNVAFGGLCTSEIQTCTNGVLSGTYTNSGCTVAVASSCSLPRGGTINHGESATGYQSGNVVFGGSCTSELRSCTDGILDGSFVNSGCTVLAASDCSFDGNIITNGSGVLVYQDNTVSCGLSCNSEVRICIDGSLSGSFTSTSCSVDSCGGGGGGGTLTKDDCPDGDDSPSYYDKTCEGDDNDAGDNDGHTSPYIDTCKINDSNYSTELKGAYLYSYENEITTQCPIEDSNLYDNLTRIEMAKMISVFMTDVVGVEQDFDKQCIFPDISSSLDAQYGYGITNACQLGLMGINVTNFDPYGLVSRAQFGTVLSRMLYGDRHNNSNPYYTKHLDALKIDGIMTNITDPMMLEIRGYVMLMMQRTDNYGLFVGMIPALNGVDALLY